MSEVQLAEVRSWESTQSHRGVLLEISIAAGESPETTLPGKVGHPRPARTASLNTPTYQQQHMETPVREVEVEAATLVEAAVLREAAALTEAAALSEAAALVEAAALSEAAAPPAWERMQTYAQLSLSLLCRTELLTGQRRAQLTQAGSTYGALKRKISVHQEAVSREELSGET